MKTIKRLAGMSCAVLALGCALAVSAAQPGTMHDPRGRSPDLLPKPDARIAQLRAHAAMMNPANVPAADVGDADSFGSNVIYAGLVQAGQVILAEDCSPITPTLGPDDRCVALSAQPAAATFSFDDLGRITLPAKSTSSLLCFHSTTFQNWDFLNETAAPAEGLIRYSESVTIENELLNDPSLIDPTTGAPFNGKLRVNIGTSLLDAQTMQPGQDKSRYEVVSRTCLQGAISKAALSQTYGLPDNIVDKFFKKPITIRLNISGSASLVVDSSLIFGIRFYGD